MNSEYLQRRCNRLKQERDEMYKALKLSLSTSTMNESYKQSLSKTLVKLNQLEDQASEDCNLVLSLESQIQGYKQRQEKFEQLVETIQVLQNKYSQEIQGLSQKQRTLQEENSSLQNQVKQLQDKVRNQDEEIKKRDNQISAINVEKNKVKLDKQQLQEMVKKQQNDMKRMKNESEDDEQMKQQLHELKQQFQNVLEKYEATEQELQCKQEMIENLQTRCSNYEKQLKWHLDEDEQQHDEVKKLLQMSQRQRLEKKIESMQQFQYIKRLKQHLVLSFFLINKVTKSLYIVIVQYHLDKHQGNHYLTLKISHHIQGMTQSIASIVRIKHESSYDVAEGKNWHLIKP